MIVYVDSNILFNDPYLNSQKTKVVLDKIEATNGKLKIPYVVQQETLNNLLVELSKLTDSFQKNINGLTKLTNKLGEQQKPDVLDLSRYKEDNIRSMFFKRYKQLIDAGLIEIISHQSMDHELLVDDLLHRALNSVKPFSPHKEEFKDTMIWKTIIHDIEINNYEKCIFITNNTSDFYDEKGEYFHQHLKNDIPKGVTLNNYLSLPKFIESDEFKTELEVKTSMEIEPSKITVENLKRISQKIDSRYITEKLNNEYIYNVTQQLNQFSYNLSKNVSHYQTYFPLLVNDIVQIQTSKNYFEDYVSVIITDVREIKITTEDNFLIVSCELIVIPKLITSPDIYPSQLIRSYLVMSISFTINEIEEFNEFDSSYIYPFSQS